MVLVSGEHLSGWSSAEDSEEYLLPQLLVSPITWWWLAAHSLKVPFLTWNTTKGRAPRTALLVALAPSYCLQEASVPFVQNCLLPICPSVGSLHWMTPSTLRLYLGKGQITLESLICLYLKKPQNHLMSENLNLNFNLDLIQKLKYNDLKILLIISFWELISFSRNKTMFFFCYPLRICLLKKRKSYSLKEFSWKCLGFF